ncbi:DUF2236 domain-containing protein [Curvibacter sp. CHRR-16]|nr:DUF2236 domain-containing protein [Curvibacter sp. CHRR-16]
MRFAADPLADNTIAAVVGLTPLVPNTPQAEQACNHLAQVTRQFAHWNSNASLHNWKPVGHLDPTITQALQDYLQQGMALPAWADTGKIQRAEQIFLDHSTLSCLSLFCASLPECYVPEDLSTVLHIAGQLEAHTEHRIRSTAAMIFPVMFPGGLTDPSGSGIAQILKVRLIHSTIRHLILRETPQQALQTVATQWAAGLQGSIAAQQKPLQASLYQSLLFNGWHLGRDGLPCNQEEMAYTLLTFSYVFLRTLRQLGQALPQADEEAYLHCWNVTGHLLGIRAELMAHTMEEAQVLFDTMQARCAPARISPDPRPPLANALMQTMANVIPWKLAKPWPVLLTRQWCGEVAVQALGLNGPTPLLSRIAFNTGMGLIRCIDSLLGCSLSVMLTRVVGYHFMEHLLLDQTRPLVLPEHLLNPVRQSVAQLGQCSRSAHWQNRLERWLSKKIAANAPLSALRQSTS